MDESWKPNRRGAALARALAALACALSSCAEEPAPPPDVILVVFDTTRADDVSVFEPERGVTPVVDALAAGGQRFRNAYSLYTVTVPSHVSMFVGRAAHEARVADSLFTLLAEAGYRTYAFSGNGNVSVETLEVLAPVHVSDPRLHERTTPAEMEALLTRSGEPFVPPQALPEERRFAHMRNVRVLMGSGRHVTDAALEAMAHHPRGEDAQPFFLFVNYNDAHDPYFPEPPFDERFAAGGESKFNGNLWSPEQRQGEVALRDNALSVTAAGLTPADIERARALHLAELAFADRQLGRLLAGLEERGLMDRAAVFVVADHGEAFGEDGRMAHGGPGIDALLRVPLVVALPESFGTAPATLEHEVDLRDLKPTILELAGVEDRSSSGRSLLPILRDPGAQLSHPREPVALDGAEGTNLVPGQGDAATEELRRRLQSLGYTR